MQLKKASLFLAIVLLTGSTACASLAEAEFTNFQVVLSGPGMGFLVDGSHGEGYVRRVGNANTEHFDYSNFWSHPWYTDTPGSAVFIGGALSSIGSVTTAFDSNNNIVMTSERVLARASGDDAHADSWLAADSQFDILGIPPVGSTITVTPVIGGITFLEQLPPHASAELYGSVTAFKYVGGDPVIIEMVSDIQTSTDDVFTINPFTFDLSDHVGDSYLNFSVSLTAIATVTPIPVPSSLALFGIGLTALRRRRR